MEDPCHIAVKKAFVNPSPGKKGRILFDPQGLINLPEAIFPNFISQTIFTHLCLTFKQVSRVQIRPFFHIMFQTIHIYLPLVAGR